MNLETNDFSIRKHAFIRTWKRHRILQERLEARDLINIWLLEITHVIYHNVFLGNRQILWHINKIFQSTCNKQPYILGTIN